MTRAIWLLLVTAVATGCDNNPLSPSDVVSHTWELVSLQRDESNAVIIQDPSQYTLRLGDDGRAAVKSDCNSCGGTYTLDDNRLELGAIACTRVGCPNGSLDPEYASALEGRKDVALTDSTLVIRGNGISLRFRRR